MKLQIFTNEFLYNKILYMFFFKNWRLKFLKFYFQNWIYIKKYLNFFFFKLLYQVFILNNVINIYLKKIPILNLLKNVNLNKKFIQKGLKFKNIGIYIRNFLKYSEDSLDSIKYCYLIIRFKRKNLFMTLLHSDGNVLCKTNIGSCGFKKKVKFTGFAIKRTSKRFSKKILGSFIKTVYIVNKNCKKKMYKIKDLLFLKKNLNIFNKNNKQIKNKKNKIRKKVNNKLKKDSNILKKKKKFIEKKIYYKNIIRENIKDKKIFNKFLNYRKYPYIKRSIQKAFNIKIRVKSNFKFWGFRFVMYGLARRFRWFDGIEVRLPISHSDGLRLKKKRRV